MFISPTTAIEKGWVTHPQCTTLDDFKQRSFVSPNAIDFTLDRLFTIDDTKEFIISETYKQMRCGDEQSTNQGYWTLGANSVYDGMSDFYVTVPDGVAALVVVRSTFNRNGIFITTGLWDSGYVGAVGMAIHNRSGVALIAPHTRIGQLIFVASENAGTYLGGYNHKINTHYSSIYDTNITSTLPK
jgi:deoxycytidine triphosphate deaminase